jgi:hypothetical protein
MQTTRNDHAGPLHATFLTWALSKYASAIFSRNLKVFNFETKVLREIHLVSAGDLIASYRVSAFWVKACNCQ